MLAIGHANNRDSVIYDAVGVAEIAGCLMWDRERSLFAPSGHQAQPELTREQQLVAAIVMQAIEDIHANPPSPWVNDYVGLHGRWWTRRESALAWVRSRTRRSFGFDWCCDHIGFDVERARQAILCGVSI